MNEDRLKALEELAAQAQELKMGYEAIPELGPITEITSQISITDGKSAAQTPLASLGYRAVLCLDSASFDDSRSSDGLVRRLIHLQPQESSLPRFDEAVAALQELVANHGRVLVHCNKGECRSVCVVAAYLIREHGENPEQALRRVACLRKSELIPRQLEILVLSQG